MAKHVLKSEEVKSSTTEDGVTKDISQWRITLYDDETNSVEVKNAEQKN